MPAAQPAPPLPYLTPEMPGTGGSIKSSPSAFVVEEIPLYQPAGQGEHVYLSLTREGQTTRDVVSRLARALDLPESALGYAGLKDKEALVTQTFSLHLPGVPEEEVLKRAKALEGLTVHWAMRHANKLKPGHLLGNRFHILVSGAEGRADQARETAAELIRRGVANFFGGQRFGMEGDNAERGRELVHTGRGPQKKWLRTLLLSAYQSELFNRWLARRIGDGLFAELVRGDIAKKTDTGGLFTVEDTEVEAPRLLRREITYTGPIYGAKLMWAAFEAGERERAVLAEDGVDEERLKKARLTGTRRPARLYLPEIAVEPDPEGFRVSFALPKGAYATVVMREIMKPV